MIDAERIEQLETCLRHIWGVMLLADSVIDDPKVKAAMRKVDQECRKTKLRAREGLVFIEPEA